MKKFILFLLLASGLIAQTANSGHAADAGGIAADAGGDVVGPASSTNNAFARFSGTTGKLLQDSPDLTYSSPTMTVPDAFNVSSAGSISLTGGSLGNITINAYGVGGASDKNIYLNTVSGGWGHVGIGQYAGTIPLSAAPGFSSKQLHIADYAGAGVLVDCVAGVPAFIGRFTGNIPSSPTAPANNQGLVRMDSHAYDGTAYSTDPASVLFSSSQAWLNTAHGTDVRIRVIANNTTASFQALGITNLGQLSSTPTQPVNVATTPGTTGGNGFLFTGAVGGNTTIATTGVGGIGSAISLTGGTGGTAALAATAGTGGAGGGLTLASGAGGASAVTGSGTGTGGNAGAAAFSTGVGGAASTSTGVNLGGNGGSWTFTTGAGGAATNGSSNTGGAGGAINITSGGGGTGATAAGNSGTITISTGTSTATVGSILLRPGSVNGLTLSTSAATFNSTLTVAVSNTTDASSSSAASVTTLGGLGVAKKIYANTAVIDGSAATTFTGGAGNMTITAGTGASRTLSLQSTTSGSTATTALLLDASQNATFTGNILHSAATAFTIQTTTAQNVILGYNSSAAVTVSSAGATGIRFNGYGSGALTSDASGNITAVSDARMKDVVRPFERGLSAILALHPQTYHWKKETGMDTEHEYSGFIAQDVQASIPEATIAGKDGILSLQDRPITAALVNSVKELEARSRSSVDWLARGIALAALGLAIRANLRKK